MIEPRNKSECGQVLRCRHCIGPNCKDYVMPCHVIKSMGDGRVKVRVFGDRNWKGHDEKSRIRYVAAHRVKLRSQP